MKYRLGSVVTGVVVFLLFAGLSRAAAASANISKSYNTSQKIANGSIVSLDPGRSGYIQLANSDNGSRLLGIAVAAGDSLLAVDSDTSKAQVAISGTADVLVSSLGGDVKVGDQIAVSPFNGIGMKAVPGSRTIGIAQTAFNSSSEGAIDKQVSDKDGREKNIRVGYVRVSIVIGTNIAQASTNLNSFQKAAKALTGHTVSTLRAVLGLLVAVGTILILVTLIYSSAYSVIISIGRNPLAKYSLLRALGSVVGLAVLITLVAGLLIFFLLS
jgi:hypothetical protein